MSEIKFIKFKNSFQTISCARCAYVNTYGNVYECRKHAPITTVSGVYDKTYWPKVRSNDWCGEFQNNV